MVVVVAARKPRVLDPRAELRSTIDSLEPSKRSTPEQRRRLLIGALLRAEELAYSSEMPPSVNALGVKELRTIVKMLADLDHELGTPATMWGSDSGSIAPR